MYIPSESVYYEIVINSSTENFALFDYALKRHIIVVSPNTFYAYLMSVVYGLKGMKIDEQAQLIVRKIEGIQKNFSDFEEELATLGKHLANAGAKFSEVQEKSEKIARNLENLTE